MDPIAAAAALLTALLALLPRSPAARCIEQRRARIVAAAASAEQDRGVPAGVLLAVGFLETHLGCDRGEGGNWGAPIDARHRHTAGTPDSSARILQRGYALCGTWFAAVTRYRSGACVFRRHLIGYEAPFAIGLVGRMYARAGLAAPERLRVGRGGAP